MLGWRQVSTLFDVILQQVQFNSLPPLRIHSYVLLELLAPSSTPLTCPLQWLLIHNARISSHKLRGLIWIYLLPSSTWDKIQRAGKLLTRTVYLLELKKVQIVGPQHENDLVKFLFRSTELKKNAMNHAAVVQTNFHHLQGCIKNTWRKLGSVFLSL